MKTNQLAALPAITQFGGMEFSTFRLAPGVTEAELIPAVETMVQSLYAAEPGFLGHAVLRGAEGVYVDVIFATSQARAAELCGKWGTGPFAPACLPYLEKIQEGSAQLAFFERIR
ncbi:hypothetical protein [Acidovorax sp.]|uniref:hypothetical protein n=1 Tax=Acidovorax sp. TaxID=1872122 RepID=UPI002619C6FF|nr:hypothetical protein [Acidovorax sp.]